MTQAELHYRKMTQTPVERLIVSLSVPTIIFSLWGINVGVPFANNPFGFWIVTAIALVMMMGAFLLMYKKKMF